MAPTSNRMRRRSAGTAVKIVVTGPFAAGKTTLIRTISEITVLSTEKGITDETRSRKTDTTVAMDFGRITIDRDLVLYLFGTPGQDRFDFMWEILGEGMLGYVLLVDATRPDSLDEAVGILQAFRKMAHVPFVVGLNRSEGMDEEEESRIRDVLDLHDVLAGYKEGAEYYITKPCTSRDLVYGIRLVLGKHRATGAAPA